MEQGRHVLFGLILCALCACRALCAPFLQTAAQADSPSQPYRLRTYVSRVQVPTAVLGRDLSPITNLNTDAFAIRLDGGPEFHPTRLRIEGDDPLTVAILIDATGSQPDIIKRVAGALAQLVPDQLHSEDRVSIYAADCRMFRTRLNEPANGDDMKEGVVHALAAVHPPGTKPSHCRDKFRLWDFASYMFAQMRGSPGRHVALIVSSGEAGKNSIGLVELIRFAGLQGVSVFGLRDEEVVARQADSVLHFPGGTVYRESEDPFEILCASTGGVSFIIDPVNINKSLAAFLRIVRSRYILEFPRPDGGVSGLHDMRVAVPSKTHFLVRSAGASYVGLDPNASSDPTVIPSAASPAVFGTRHPMQPPKH